MRKYFLLSAVALLASTNVKAELGYADITVKAVVERVSKVDCTDLNFGTIYVPDGVSTEVTLGQNRVVEATNGAFVQNASLVRCTKVESNGEGGTQEVDALIGNWNIPATVELNGEAEDWYLTVNLELTDDGVDGLIGGTLTIPAHAPADTYNGSFHIVQVAE